MSQNIEIEFKNLLTAEEFLRLAAYFNVDSSRFKKQVNHYFDTPSFSLKKIGSALRIREKGTAYELTLKQPAKTGLLETNQTLSAQEAQGILQGGELIDGEVREAVFSLIADADSLEYFGSLSTERTEFLFKGGLLVLDHSYYLNTEDYELEYEVDDEKEGYTIFKALLDELKIPLRKTDNKIARFYAAKYLRG